VSRAPGHSPPRASFLTGCTPVLGVECRPGRMVAMRPGSRQERISALRPLRPGAQPLLEHRRNGRAAGQILRLRLPQEGLGAARREPEPRKLDRVGAARPVGPQGCERAALAPLPPVALAQPERVVRPATTAERADSRLHRLPAGTFLRDRGHRFHRVVRSRARTRARPEQWMAKSRSGENPGRLLRRTERRSAPPGLREPEYPNHLGGTAHPPCFTRHAHERGLDVHP